MAEHELTYFKRFYESLHPGLLAYARYIVQSREDALEVVNDVFLKVWERKEEFGPFNEEAQQRLKSYLYRSVKNASLNRLRQQRKTWMQLDEEVPEPKAASHSLDQKEVDAQFKDWLEELPIRCRQVFLMSRIDGLSNKEISELMEISIKTVENQMTKALKFFRKKMGVG